VGDCAVTTPSFTEFGFGEEFPLFVIEYLHEVALLVFGQHSPADGDHILWQEADGVEGVAGDSGQLVNHAGGCHCCGVEYFEEIGSAGDDIEDKDICCLVFQGVFVLELQFEVPKISMLNSL
jgi:hypothetical protein